MYIKRNGASSQPERIQVRNRTGPHQRRPRPEGCCVVQRSPICGPEAVAASSTGSFQVNFWELPRCPCHPHGAQMNLTNSSLGARLPVWSSPCFTEEEAQAGPGVGVGSQQPGSWEETESLTRAFGQQTQSFPPGLLGPEIKVSPAGQRSLLSAPPAPSPPWDGQHPDQRPRSSSSQRGWGWKNVLPPRFFETRGWGRRWGAGRLTSREVKALGVWSAGDRWPLGSISPCVHNTPARHLIRNFYLFKCTADVHSLSGMSLPC